MLNQLPTSADFNQGRVVDPSRSEAIRQRLYDFLLYPTAGQQQFTFFALPIGQGITSAQGATVGTAKTLADTNMTAASQLPSGKRYIVETIEVVFYPGSVSTANTYTPANPSLFNATSAATVAGQANDLNLIMQSGVLDLKILDKSYLTETPLGVFPPKTHLTLRASVASNSATTGEVALVNAYQDGRPYIVEPTITLDPAVTFNITVSFPGAVATPSGFNGRLGVILDGYLMRAGQ